MKGKNHIIILIDAEKAFGKIEHPLRVKTFKVVIEEENLNIIKAIYEELTANIVLNGQKTKSLSLKIRNKNRDICFHYFFSK